MPILHRVQRGKIKHGAFQPLLFIKLPVLKPGRVAFLAFADFFHQIFSISESLGVGGPCRTGQRQQDRQDDLHKFRLLAPESGKQRGADGCSHGKECAG